MTMFIVFAIALLALALFVVLRPLLAGGGGGDPEARRKLAALSAARDAGVLSPEEFEAKRAALATPAPDAAPPAQRGLALVLAALVPALAFVVYWLVGEPRALDPANLQRSAASVDAAASAPEMENAIASLAARLKDSPEDLDGWLLLGRAYKSTGRFAEARDAMQHAFDLAPDNIDVLTEYAESLAMSSPERRIDGRARELLQQALQRDPTNQRALWLLGASAAQDGRYAEAAASWEALLAQIPADAEIAATLREQIDKARERAGMPPLAPVAAATADAGSTTPPPVATADAGGTPAPATNAPPVLGNASNPAPQDPGAAAGGPRITVTVDVAPALKAQVGANDVLFVFARLPQGPRMPLAIQRMAASALPVTLVLDDSMAMMPALKLSSAEQVIIGARISKSGNASPQPGDLQVLTAPITVKTQRDPVVLTISEVVQ